LFWAGRVDNDIGPVSDDNEKWSTSPSLDVLWSGLELESGLTRTNLTGKSIIEQAIRSAHDLRSRVFRCASKAEKDSIDNNELTHYIQVKGGPSLYRSQWDQAGSDEIKNWTNEATRMVEVLIMVVDSPTKAGTAEDDDDLY
jgi:hypothetical protein